MALSGWSLRTQSIHLWQWCYHALEAWHLPHLAICVFSWNLSSCPPICSVVLTKLIDKSGAGTGTLPACNRTSKGSITWWISVVGTYHYMVPLWDTSSYGHVPPPWAAHSSAPKENDSRKGARVQSYCIYRYPHWGGRRGLYKTRHRQVLWILSAIADKRGGSKILWMFWMAPYVPT